jgi:uncharacterized membrane protein YgcG
MDDGIVDIGGDRYFTGSQKPYNKGFKGRKDFISAFGDNPKTEDLLRKYMPYRITPSDVKVDSDDDRKKLLNILQIRFDNIMRNLKDATELQKRNFNYINLQKISENILEIIQKLGRSDIKAEPIENTKNVECVEAKKEIKKISGDKNLRFRLILQIAWYLLHPDEVPQEVRCKWAKLIEGLSSLQLRDVVAEIQGVSGAVSADALTVEPLNYFKKINLSNVAKSKTINEVFDTAVKSATTKDLATEQMKARLESLLKILEMKKYLDRKDDKTINNSIKKIGRSMINNPMNSGDSGNSGVSGVSSDSGIIKGGKSSKSGKGSSRGGGGNALDKPLRIAMKPLYDHFKHMYDPIYSFLEESIQDFKKNKTNKLSIPSLTTLLHICNNLKTQYGVYKITGINSSSVNFIKSMLTYTEGYMKE